MKKEAKMIKADLAKLNLVDHRERRREEGDRKGRAKRGRGQMSLSRNRRTQKMAERERERGRKGGAFGREGGGCQMTKSSSLPLDQIKVTFFIK